MTKSRLEGDINDFIFLESPKVTFPFKKGEKTIKVKGHRTKTGYVKPHERKIKEGENKKLVNQYLASMDHASRHLKKEPEIAKLSGKELVEWQEWQQYYKEKLFRSSISPHEDYYSDAIMVGLSPQHTKALISKYQAKDPSSMGVDLAADFEELYQRTKNNIPKKHNMDPSNLVEIKLINESGIPGLVGGIHQRETYICKFEDESKAIHKVMGTRPVAGEVGTYEICKILNWDSIPETVQYNYGEGEGSTQKFIKDSKESIDEYNKDGVVLNEKHFNALSIIFIMDMINGNSDRHSGNIIIDPDGKCWGIDNEGIGSLQAKIYLDSLNEWAEKGEGSYIPMLTILEHSIGNDQKMFEKFKTHVNDNLIRVRNHQNKLIKFWNENDNINEDCKKNITNNINYLSRYYTEINKSEKITLPFKR